MANTHTKSGPQTVDAAYDQVKDFNEQAWAAARKAGNLYLDSYEKTFDQAVELELKLAGLSQQDWLRNLIEAQVDFAREISNTYTTTARSLLR
ncbi:MAG: hypothetical protein JOY58_09845 [Solirubrobacterales bacterium]|nr:hypothetical protein [Solirubrobacterales bacterium]